MFGRIPRVGRKTKNRHEWVIRNGGGESNEKIQISWSGSVLEMNDQLHHMYKCFFTIKKIPTRIGSKCKAQVLKL